MNMERDSIFYLIRRKLQVVAHKIFPDEMMSKIYFRIVLKKKLNLSNPMTFNEKLQWLKLNYYPNNPLVIQCSDKWMVRKYISNKGYKDTLVPLLGRWRRAENIEWDKLPDKFVLKCNHGCAYNIVCSNKSKLNKSVVVNQLNKWMKEDFGAFNIELHYSKIYPHVIICEEYLGDEKGITDYKFFCFNGIPRFIYVSNNLIHDRQAEIGFFNLDGTKMPIKRDDYTDILEIQLPDFYDEMLKMSYDLSSDFPFVRVDFFLANDRYYFAEPTFTPGACMMPFTPDKYDLKLGKMLDLSVVR